MGDRVRVATEDLRMAGESLLVCHEEFRSAQDVADRGADAVEHPRLAEQLLLWARDPERAEQEIAAVLVPEARVGVYAWLTARRLSDTPIDVRELEQVARTAEHVGEADVTSVPLPAGPAVRIRGIRAAAHEDGPGELVEEVRWWVLAPLLTSGPAPQAIEISMCWTAAGAHEADDLAELADDIAATLVVRPVE
jgi:hypothetical protein